MDSDQYGRTISMATANGVDTYTVVDPNNSNFTITFPFPTGTSTYFVYSIINQYEPQTVDSTGPLGQNFAQLVQTQWGGNLPTGNTSDRIVITDNMPTETGVGMMYFDQTLMKPIWYVGWGPTGWVDATGTQV